MNEKQRTNPASHRRDEMRYQEDRAQVARRTTQRTRRIRLPTACLEEETVTDEWFTHGTRDI